LLALPTAAAAVSLLLGNLLERERIREGDELSAETCQRIVSRLVLYMVILHGFVLTALVGPAPWMFRPVFLLVGITLVGIGNLLPRTRPNSVIGIRTSRALSNRHVWIRLHRVAGRLTVGAGAGISIAAFLPGASVDYITSLIPVAAVGMFVAYLLRLELETD
jgi:uncharacterized membrane protein